MLLGQKLGLSSTNHQMGNKMKFNYSMGNKINSIEKNSKKSIIHNALNSQQKPQKSILER
jgi:hypothetical protein